MIGDGEAVSFFEIDSVNGVVRLRDNVDLEDTFTTDFMVCRHTPY